MTKCQITCKSLQKSSRCQNFLRVWHLVIFRADQLKKPPCMIQAQPWKRLHHGLQEIITREIVITKPHHLNPNSSQSRAFPRFLLHHRPKTVRDRNRRQIVHLTLESFSSLPRNFLMAASLCHRVINYCFLSFQAISALTYLHRLNLVLRHLGF